jgi:hypothetical protein
MDQVFWRPKVVYPTLTILMRRQYKTRFAGLVRDFKADDYLPTKELRRYDVVYALCLSPQVYKL